MPFRVMRPAMVPFLLALSGCLSKSGREHPDGLAAPDVDGDTDTDSDSDTDTDSGPVDADGDGWSLADGDCDDTDATVHPGAADTWYDGTDPIGSDGNKSVDPMLHGYHLAADSPLVDAGDPALLDPDGSPSDMGAFGGPFADAWDLDGDGWASWWLPGGYDSATSPGFDCDDEDPKVYPGSGC